MAKIFQLEFFIKEISLWKLPHGSEDHDETCVDVTVFGNQNVSISGYVFGKNSTMNRGQNFLFTLDAMPVDGNKVSFNVFKKAYNKEKNLLGNGNIPIEKIFGDVLSQVFKNAASTPKPQQTLATPNPNVGSTNNPQIANQNPTPNNDSKSGVSTQNSKPVDQKATKSPTNTTHGAKGTVDTKAAKNQGNANATSTKIPVPQKAIQNQSSANAPQPVDQTQNQSAPVVGSTNDAPANMDPIKNLKTVNVTSSGQSSVISSLSKDVYPIIGCDSTQWGTICILMRLTSFGNFSAHPIIIHQNHKDIILQNTPNSATYKCAPLDMRDTRYGSRSKTQPPINRRTDLFSSSRSSSSSSSSSCTSIRSPRSASTCLDLCPGPPVSPSGQYEEFTAEVNDNMLCVRMPKNAGTVTRIYDNNKSANNVCALRNDGQNYPDRKIPIIRGNRKYPAHYGTISTIPTCCESNQTIYNPRQRSQDYSIHCNENRFLQDENISCPSNVQITRATNDPKRDVFLLNIGRDARTGNGIQLEMKTPKNPLARGSANKQTTSVQTYDDEFVGGTKRVGKKGGKKEKK